MYILIKPNIVLRHGPPMPPFKSNQRWTAIYLQNLPRECWHHTLESLMTRGEVRILRTVVLVGRNDGVVRANFEHVFTGLWRPTIDGEGVTGLVNSAPVADRLFKTCFDLPVFDQVFDQVRKTSCFMVFCFGCDQFSRLQVDDGLGRNHTLIIDASSILVIRWLPISPARGAVF